MKLWFKRQTQGPQTVTEPERDATVTTVLAVASDEDEATVTGADAVVLAAEPPAAAAAPQTPSAEAAGEDAAAGRLRMVAKPDAPTFKSDHKSLYKEFLRGMYDAVLVADPKGHVIDSNPRVSELLSYSAADLWDMPIDEIIRGVNPQVLDRIRRNVADQRYVLLDATCRRRDGTGFPAEVAISRVNLINDGDLVFCVRSIERRRKAQQRLRSQHNAIMNAPVAFAICDPRGVISFANPAMLEMWAAGKTSDLIEQNIRALWQTPAGIERALGMALTGDRWVGTLQAQGQQGRTFTVSAMIAPDRDLRNEIIGVVASFVEVTPA